MIVRTGLIGCDIGKSRSPEIHEREAAAQGFPMRYELFDLRDRPGDLASAIAEAEARGFAGLNITHPFKQAVIPLLDRLSPDAEAIGAVNTVLFDDRGRTGYNTDCRGHAEALARALPDADLSRVVQFGAGGAGAAVAQALLDAGAATLLLVDVEPARAARLADRLNARFGAGRATTAPATREVLATATGVVNATPIGMAAHPGTPFPPAWLDPRLWVSDVIYFPRETDLLRQARAIGCPTLDGGGMAVFQAAHAFDLFTGRTADRARMLAAFDMPAGAA